MATEYNVKVLVTLALEYDRGEDSASRGSVRLMTDRNEGQFGSAGDLGSSAVFSSRLFVPLHSRQEEQA